MTTDEAIEALGSAVAAMGGEGDDALDHVKDELARLRALEGGDAHAYMVCVAGACEEAGDEDLALADAVARMHELANREGGYGDAAQPVQLIAYTRDALAKMAAARVGGEAAS